MLNYQRKNMKEGQLHTYIRRRKKKKNNKMKRNLYP